MENGASANALEYRREMRLEVRNNLAFSDNKLIDVNTSLNDLKAVNEHLRCENKELWQGIHKLNGKNEQIRA